jgi:uncharacterized membrane-anchored protein
VYVKIHPRFYWLVIIATTTLGTEISDFIVDLHLGYTMGSVTVFWLSVDFTALVIKFKT